MLGLLLRLPPTGRQQALRIETIVTALWAFEEKMVVSEDKEH